MGGLEETFCADLSDNFGLTFCDLSGDHRRANDGKNADGGKRLQSFLEYGVS